MLNFLGGLKPTVNTPVGCTFSMSSLYEKSVVLGPWTCIDCMTVLNWSELLSFLSFYCVNLTGQSLGSVHA